MWGSSKNRDGYGSRAFRCCWTRQTCSLLKTDLRGLLSAISSIVWLARLIRGGLGSSPPGLVLIAQLPGLSGACFPRDRQVPCAECLAVSCSPAERNLKLLLTAHARSCYKERVQGTALCRQTRQSAR